MTIPTDGTAAGDAPTGGYPTAQPNDRAGRYSDRPRLPRSALVAFRRSGGLRFSSRGVLIYRNGWIAPLSAPKKRTRHLGPAALLRLKRQLLRSRLNRAPAAVGSATRDGYSYEIVTRIGSREYVVELSDPLPPTQARLARMLSRWLAEAT